MKRTLSIALAVLTIGLLGSCSKINERLDNLEKKVIGIENEQIASINSQISGITSSISDLGQIRSDISSLKQSASDHSVDIFNLEEADRALKDRILNLEDYVDAVLPNYAEKEWVEATFSTLAQYEATCDTIAKIDARIGALDAKLSKDIKATADSLTKWVNKQFEGYYTAAEMDASLAQMKSDIDSARAANKISDAKADSIAGELAKVKPEVDTVKANIRAEYKAAVKAAIEESEGKLTKELTDKITTANTAIINLTTRVTNLEKEVDKLTGRVEKLEGMIQSVVIVPAYSDGSVEVKDDTLYLDCIIGPASTVSSLTKTNFTVLVNKVLTKAVNIETINITDDKWFSKNAQNGTVSLKIPVKNYIPTSDDSTITVAVKVNYVHSDNLASDYTTEFVPVTVSAANPIVEYVEIGGVKWATKNLGAEAVTDYGDYFAWGATELAYSSLSSNTFTFVASRPASYGGSGWIQSKGFDYENTPYYNGSTYTKYTSSDSKTVLESVDDAATALLGSGWRMPTSAEFKALYDACLNGSYDKTTNPSGASASVGKGVYWCTSYDGVAGCLFCDGTNKLFFPAAGYGDGTSLNRAGSSGYYWSSSLYTDNTDSAYDLGFNSDVVGPRYGGSRYYGFSVRPVKDPSAAPKCDVEVKFYYVSELLPDKSSQFPDCSSLAYTISSQSKDVTSVKVAMATKSAIDELLESGYTREKIASEYYSPELSECLSELSTNGAFSDIFYSLDLSTEYEIIVLASNSYGESALAYDIKTTAPYTGELVIGDYTITDEVSLGEKTSKQTFTVISKDGTDSNISIKNLAYNDNFEWYATYDKDAHTLTLDGSAYRYETYGNIFLVTLYSMGSYDAGYWAGNTGTDPIVFRVDPTTHQICGLQINYALFASSGTSIIGYFKYFAAGNATIVKGDGSVQPASVNRQSFSAAKMVDMKKASVGKKVTNVNAMRTKVSVK